MTALYRKYRPRTFSEVVGQPHVTQVLGHALAQGQLAHAYLFCGPRGSGKTTVARILAKAINCRNPVGGEPDGTCDLCLAADEGRLMDLAELDAASHRGIDDIRSLREQVRYPATLARTKVYILDEVHMLTKEAANAFLKTLEEPPPNVLFCLATTEVHKILPTIVSRCQRFDFRRLTGQECADRLAEVAHHEKITVNREALGFLVARGEGSMRDMLGLMDQVVAFHPAGTALDVPAVATALGLYPSALTEAIVDAIAASDGSRFLTVLARAREQGADAMLLAAQLLDHARVILYRTAGLEPPMVTASSPAVLAAQQEALGQAGAIRIMSACLAAQVQMARAPNPFLVLETMLLTRALPGAASIDLTETRTHGSVTGSAPGVSRPAAPLPAPSPTQVPPAAPSPASTPTLNQPSTPASSLTSAQPPTPASGPTIPPLPAPEPVRADPIYTSAQVTAPMGASAAPDSPPQGAGRTSPRTTIPPTPGPASMAQSKNAAPGEATPRTAALLALVGEPVPAAKRKRTRKAVPSAALLSDGAPAPDSAIPAPAPAPAPNAVSAPSAVSTPTLTPPPAPAGATASTSAPAPVAAPVIAPTATAPVAPVAAAPVPAAEAPPPVDEEGSSGEGDDDGAPAASPAGMAPGAWERILGRLHKTSSRTEAFLKEVVRTERRKDRLVLIIQRGHAFAIQNLKDVRHAALVREAIEKEIGPTGGVIVEEDETGSPAPAGAPRRGLVERRATESKAVGLVVDAFDGEIVSVD